MIMTHNFWFRFLRKIWSDDTCIQERIFYPFKNYNNLSSFWLVSSVYFLKNLSIANYFTPHLCCHLNSITGDRLTTCIICLVIDAVFFLFPYSPVFTEKSKYYKTNEVLTDIKYTRNFKKFSISYSYTCACFTVDYPHLHGMTGFTQSPIYTFLFLRITPGKKNSLKHQGNSALLIIPLWKSPMKLPRVPSVPKKSVYLLNLLLCIHTIICQRGKCK